MARIGRFAYYERLTPEQKAIYRKSDAIVAVPLTDVTALRELTAKLEEQLATGKRTRVAAAAKALVGELVGQLGVDAPKVHVREVRPQLDDGELHGLYTFAHDGRTPKLEVWMRTAAQTKVVRFRTFLRTLVHEVLHHLDVTAFELEESFHTEGFFRRESSLVRQLAPAAKKPSAAKRAEKRPGKRRPFVQLDLF